MADAPLYAVIIAGGRGTRFWPLSRRARPKQVLALTGEHSLIRQTVDRLAPLVPPERVLVITGPDMEAAVRAELPMLAADQVLVEPSGRNTAPCIGWAAVEVARRAGPDAVLAVLPSDHVIGRPEILREALAAAADAARQGGPADGPIVTLGIRPDRPETGFGYLELGAQVGERHGQPLHEVARFREKPDRATAEAFLAAGSYLWNAGMFVFRATTMRAAFRSHLPRSATALDALDTAPERLAELWPELEATSIDYGVMERHDGILTVPCDPAWSDVGAWPAVASLLPPLPGGHGTAGECIAVQSSDNVVHVPDKLVALVGVEGLVVVDAGDALLVMDQERAQALKEVLGVLDARGLHEYT